MCSLSPLLWSPNTKLPTLVLTAPQIASDSMTALLSQIGKVRIGSNFGWSQESVVCTVSTALSIPEVLAILKRRHRDTNNSHWEGHYSGIKMNTCLKRKVY